MNLAQLRITDIGADGLKIEAQLTEPWFAALVREVLGENTRIDSTSRASLQLQRDGDQIYLVGGAYLAWHPQCDRCLAPFEWQQQFPLHLVLLRTSKVAGYANQNGAEDIEDLDVSGYEGDTINLIALLKEQLILQLPMSARCSENCQGLCPTCGADRNKAPCTCPPTPTSSPFDVLRQLKR